MRGEGFFLSVYQPTNQPCINLWSEALVYLIYLVMFNLFMRMQNIFASLRRFLILLSYQEEYGKLQAGSRRLMENETQEKKLIFLFENRRRGLNRFHERRYYIFSIQYIKILFLYLKVLVTNTAWFCNYKKYIKRVDCTTSLLM